MQNIDELRAVVTIWERSIDTQKHFNDLSLRTRQLGVTIVGALLGVGLVIKTEMPPVTFCWVGFTFLCWIKIPILSLACFAAGFMMYLTKTLDIDVYHRMLRGAVNFNEDIERKHLNKFLSLNQGLSETISVYSRYKDASRQDQGGTIMHMGKKVESLRNRMARYYWFGTGGLFAIGLAVAFSTSRDITPMVPGATAIGVGVQSSATQHQPSSKTTQPEANGH